MPSKQKSSAVTTTTLEKDIIEIDSDSDEVGHRMLAGNVLCGEMKQFMPNESCGQPDNAAENGETSRSSMQIVCADDWASGFDKNYEKYLERLKNEDPHLLEYNDRDSSSKLIRNNVIYNEKYDRTPSRVVKIQPRMKPTRTVFKKKDSQEKKEDVRCRRKPPVIEPISYVKDNLVYSFKGFKNVESRAGRDAKSQTLFSGSKRLKTGTGRVNSNSISKTPPLVKTKDTLRKEGEALRGRKNPVTKKNVKSKSTIYGKDNFFQKFKARKENEERPVELDETGRVNSNSISKTPPLVKTKDTLRKEGEALRGRKNLVTKINVKSKSTSYGKDNFQKFKALKENEERLVELDESYAYVLAYLNKSTTSFGTKQLMTREKDPVCFSDCDIIAVSSHPFSDGDTTPFQGNKDHRVIDLEDGTGTEHIFNSSFSKKLIEILRQPYDEKEYREFYRAASLHSQKTRTRELRGGKDINYNIKQLAPSYLDQHPDFKKKFRCYEEDLPVALNLLRGFFYYLQNVVHEGAFKPWLHKEYFITYVV